MTTVYTDPVVEIVSAAMAEALEQVNPKLALEIRKYLDKGYTVDDFEALTELALTVVREPSENQISLMGMAVEYAIRYHAEKTRTN